MERKEARRVWFAIRTAYAASVVYKVYGTTGDPEDTLRIALRTCSKEQVRQTIAVVAHIKEHDGRFWDTVREWLYESLPEEQDGAKKDWYTEYSLDGLDDIHTTHLNGIAQALIKNWDADLEPYRSGSAFFLAMENKYGKEEALRMGSAYLKMQEKRRFPMDAADEEEAGFCEELEKTMDDCQARSDCQACSYFRVTE